MTDITYTHYGIDYIAKYEVHGDTIVVCLPDGSMRETVLRGLAPNGAAMTHLRCYAHDLKNKKNPSI